MKLSSDRVFSLYASGFSPEDIEPIEPVSSNAPVFVLPVRRPQASTGGLVMPDVVEQGQQQCLMYEVVGGHSLAPLEHGDVVILRNQMLEITHQKHGVLFISRAHIIAKVKP